MIPDKMQLRIIVEKAVLTSSGDATINSIITNIYDNLVTWYKKNGGEVEEAGSHITDDPYKITLYYVNGKPSHFTDERCK